MRAKEIIGVSVGPWMAFARNIGVNLKTRVDVCWPSKCEGLFGERIGNEGNCRLGDDIGGVEVCEQGFEGTIGEQEGFIEACST